MIGHACTAKLIILLNIIHQPTLKTTSRDQNSIQLWGIFLAMASLTLTVKNGDTNAKRHPTCSTSVISVIISPSMFNRLVFHFQQWLTKKILSLSSVFVEEIELMSHHILDKAADECQVLDFHDLMYRFTLDSFIL